MNPSFHSGAERLAQLRLAVEAARRELIEAEAELADRRVDIEAFEFEYEAVVGVLLTRLERVEADLKDYLDRIQQRRNEQQFGVAFSSVEEQFRQTWEKPRRQPARQRPAMVSKNTEAQIKKVYRQLARRCHPDLAGDDAEREYRTEMMTAVNDAYASRSLAELMALARDLEAFGEQADRAAVQKQAAVGMAAALEEELRRCKRRIRQIEMEMQSLYTHPLVELSMDAKFARRQGRDILAEMAAELERKIARKSVERDMIKSQFDNLGREGHIR
jgi:hypothetical protein